MPQCCVPMCNNRFETSYWSFFRFPADADERLKWVKAIRRDNFVPNDGHRICSWHFPEGKEKGPLRFHWNVEDLPDHRPVKREVKPSQWTNLRLLAKVCSKQQRLSVPSVPVHDLKHHLVLHADNCLLELQLQKYLGVEDTAPASRRKPVSYRYYHPVVALSFDSDEDSIPSTDHPIDEACSDVLSNGIISRGFRPNVQESSQYDGIPMGNTKTEPFEEQKILGPGLANLLNPNEDIPSKVINLSVQEIKTEPGNDITVVQDVSSQKYSSDMEITMELSFKCENSPMVPSDVNKTNYAYGFPWEASEVDRKPTVEVDSFS